MGRRGQGKGRGYVSDGRWRRLQVSGTFIFLSFVSVFISLFMYLTSRHQFTASWLSRSRLVDGWHYLRDTSFEMLRIATDFMLISNSRLRRRIIFRSLACHPSTAYPGESKVNRVSHVFEGPKRVILISRHSLPRVRASDLSKYYAKYIC